jgi:hypothetical protein
VRIPIARFGKYNRALGKDIADRVFKRSMPAAGRAVRGLLEAETIRRGIYYKKRFARGWKARVGNVVGASVQVYNKEPYAIVIEKGRRRNRRPPPRAVLIPWVMDKLGVSAKDAPRVAFLVARAIGKRGIAARPVLTDPRMQLRIQRTVSKGVLLYMQEAMKAARP